MLRVMLVLLFAAHAQSQAQTFVVDASGGSGTHFTDLQLAVTSVPDGSTLLVRAGNYSPVLIDAKGLVVLCDDNVTAGAGVHTVPFLWIRNIQAHQVVTVRALGRGGLRGPRVQNSLGAVTFDGAGATWFGPSIEVIGSSRVAIHDLSVTGHPAASVLQGKAVFANCTLRGMDGIPPISKAGGTPSSPGLVANVAQVQLVHCSVRGGDSGGATMPASPAVSMTSSTLRAMGLANHELRGGDAVAPLPPGLAITGSGIARVDAAMTIVGPISGVTLTRPSMPGLLSDTAPPGGTITVQRYGPLGVACAICISLPAAGALPLPPLPDPVWLDAASLVVEAFAAAPVTGPLVLTKNVPNQPSLRGVQFVWQAADLDANGIVAVSNPSPGFVR